MGLFDAGVTKARARQRASLLEEAAAAGGQVLEFLDGAAAAPSPTSIVAGTLKVLVGGTVTTDFHQVMVLRTGPLVHLYVQPYQGVQAMPGEHHAYLAGTLPMATVLRRAGSRVHWEGGHGEHAFNRIPAINVAAHALATTWKAGLTEITLPWLAQVRPAGGPRAHLAMQAGRYGGFTSYHVGFTAFGRLAAAVQASLVRGAEVAPAAFAVPTPFADVASGLSTL